MKIYIKLLQIILPVLFLFGGDIYAQSITTKPGGTIYDTELWLSADKVKGGGVALPSGESQLMEWIDLSGNNRSVVQYNATYQPTFSIFNQTNYNPSIYFAGAQVLSTVNTISTGSDKAYYVFVMSEVEATGRCVAFNLNGNSGARRNLVGWNEYIPFYSIGGNGSGANGTSFNNPNSTSGLIGAIYTNMGQPGRIFFNGSFQNSTNTSTTNSTPGKFVVGASLDDRAYPFNGNIQEIVVLSNSGRGDISEIEVTKINTYFAVKYGLALRGDYIVSDGTKIWDVVKNTGYSKYVFGIGRDDASGLHVKQSRSSDIPSNIIFVGDQLANLNSENTATDINDKQFVMLGYSAEPGAVESLEYSHDSTDVYLEGSLNVVNHRVGNVMKVQLTNLTSVDVNLHVSSQWVLVSNSDPTFAPANTRVYPVDMSTATAKITLKDGDYVDFAYFAEGPGGILGKLRLWLRADERNSVTTVAGNKVEKWLDQSGLGHTYDYSTVYRRQNNTTRPTFVECDAKMNFQPSIYFDAWDFLGIEPGPISVNAPDDYTSFVVYHNTSYSAQGRRLYTHGFGATAHPDAATRYPAMGFSPIYGSRGDKGGGRLYAAADGGELVGSVKGFVTKATALHMIHTHTGKGASDLGYITHDFGAYGYQIKDMQRNNFGTNFRMARAGILGGASIQGTGNASGSFIGNIAEVIFFQRALSVAEQDLIRGYLATKYGITIDPDPIILI